MRKLLACILALLLLAIPVSAQTSFVSDDSGLLTEAQADALNKTLIGYHNDYGISVAVVTTDSLNDMSAEDYAKAHYAESGYGNDCVFLLICENEGQWYIYTSGLCSEVLSESELSQIGASLMDDLQSGNYEAAFQSFAKLCADPVSAQVSANAASANALQHTQKKYVILGMLGGLLVGVAVATVLVYKAKPPKPVRRPRPAIGEEKPTEEA